MTSKMTSNEKNLTSGLPLVALFLNYQDALGEWEAAARAIETPAVMALRVRAEEAFKKYDDARR